MRAKRTRNAGLGSERAAQRAKRLSAHSGALAAGLAGLAGLAGALAGARAGAPTPAGERPLAFRFERVATTGEEAPGGAGAFTRFHSLSVDAGRVAFAAETDALEHLGAAFLHNGGATELVFVERTFDIDPTKQVSDVMSVSLAGDILAIGARPFSTIGFPPSRRQDTGVVLRLSDGAASPAPMPRTQAPDDREFTDSTQLHRPAATPGGAVFGYGVTSKEEDPPIGSGLGGVYRIAPDGSVATLLSPFQPPPTAASFDAFRFIGTATASGGDIAFWANGLVVLETSESLNLPSIFKIVNGETHFVADGLSDFPGLSNTAIFASVAYEADIDDGAVVFGASERDFIDGQLVVFDGIFTDLGGSLRAVAVTGQPKPDGDGVFTDFEHSGHFFQSGSSRAAEPRISDGRIAFITTSRPDTSPGSGLELFLEDEGALTRVVRLGDMLDGRRVRFVRDIDIDGETIGFITQFVEDESQAIYTATIDRCPGDFDANGVVGASDLMALLGVYGSPDPPSGGVGARDLNLDGSIGPGELLTVLAGFGDCPQ